MHYPCINLTVLSIGGRMDVDLVRARPAGGSPSGGLGSDALVTITVFAQTSQARRDSGRIAMHQPHEEKECGRQHGGQCSPPVMRRTGSPST
jgi:hypothetical protein